MGMGRCGRVHGGLDVRPHPLGRHARRSVAQRRARAGRGGGRDGAHEAGDARRHAQLPPPRDARREAISLDDLSGGRLELGVGPGSEGFDASVLGGEPWSPPERLARFEEFLEVLRPIIEGEATARTSLRTAHYAAVEAPSTPGTVTRPLPLTIAAGGPKGLRRAAVHGRHWVTIGPTGRGPRTPETILEAVRRQRAELDAACAAAGRAVSSIGKILLWTPTEPIELTGPVRGVERPLRGARLRPVRAAPPCQTGPYGGSMRAFEEIAARHATGLTGNGAGRLEGWIRDARGGVPLTTSEPPRRVPCRWRRIRHRR